MTKIFGMARLFEKSLGFGKKVVGLVAKNVFALLFVSLILANADLS